ncbi:MAG: ABC transporter permease subunit, partial [Bacteroidota bacterium]
LDVAIFAWSVPLIFALGLAIALARGAQSAALFPLRIFGAIYVDLFRGIPVVLLVYLVGFGVPGLGLPRPWNSPYIWGTVALVLTYSAYVAEVLRSGIESIHASQRNAAICLGLSERDTMRYVILPHRVTLAEPEADRGVALAGVDALDARAQHLGHVGRIGQHQRDGAP